ncbi:hypothetical protein K501DRAFT_277109 [Backusella circina FSU 941]|nr:hypothetical protein K501DRAFT_277109 [Backusella circina FSU 941]
MLVEDETVESTDLSDNTVEPIESSNSTGIEYHQVPFFFVHEYWVLGDGTVLEDQLYKLGITLKYEQDGNCLVYNVFTEDQLCEIKQYRRLIFDFKSFNKNKDTYNCLDASSCLLSTRPTFYDPPRDQVSLAVLPAGLFGAANTTSTQSVPSPPHRTDIGPGLEPEE